MGDITVAQTPGSSEAFGVICKLQNRHAGMGIIEAGPHQMDGDVQQMGDPCASHNAVAEEGDAFLIRSEDAIDPIFLSVSEAFKKIFASRFNYIPCSPHIASADARALKSIGVGKVDISVFTVDRLGNERD